MHLDARARSWDQYGLVGRAEEKAESRLFLPRREDAIEAVQSHSKASGMAGFALHTALWGRRRAGCMRGKRITLLVFRAAIPTIVVPNGIIGVSLRYTDLFEKAPSNLLQVIFNLMAYTERT